MAGSDTISNVIFMLLLLINKDFLYCEEEEGL